MTRRLALALLAVALVVPPSPAPAAPLGYGAIAAALDAVHVVNEVALAPDGRHLAYADTTVHLAIVTPGATAPHFARISTCTACTESGLAWSPDATRIAFVTTGPGGQGNVAVADVARGTLRVLTDAHGPVASPRWSADGTRVATICGIMSDESVTGGDVCVTSAGGGAMADVTPDLRASVQTIDWNGSSSHVLITAFASGESLVATVDVDAKSVRERWRGDGTIFATGLDNLTPGDRGISLARDGRLSAVIRQSFTAPPEIALGTIGAWRTVTVLNAHVARLTGRARNMTWTSDGMTVQGWLVEPPGPRAAGPLPLVTVVHGGAAS